MALVGYTRFVDDEKERLEALRRITNHSFRAPDGTEGDRWTDSRDTTQIEVGLLALGQVITRLSERTMYVVYSTSQHASLPSILKWPLLRSDAEVRRMISKI